MDKEHLSRLLTTATQEDTFDFLDAKRRGQIRGLFMFLGLLLCLQSSSWGSCTDVEWQTRGTMVVLLCFAAHGVEEIHAVFVLRRCTSRRRAGSQILVAATEMMAVFAYLHGAGAALQGFQLLLS